MDECGGKNPIAGLFEELLWVGGSSSNLCEFGDGKTGIHVAGTGHSESSGKFEEPFLFKTSAYLGASKGDLHLPECLCC